MTDYTELVRKMRTCIGDKKCFEKECRYWSELGCMDGNICCDAAAAIEALEASQPHWVSVRQPPKERDFYFAFTADGEAKVCDYIPSVDQWWDGDDMILSVTHWMPIEPPMEVQS